MPGAASLLGRTRPPFDTGLTWGISTQAGREETLENVGIPRVSSYRGQDLNLQPSGYESDAGIRLDAVSSVPVMVGTTSSTPRIAFIRLDVDQSVSVRLTYV